MSQDRKPPSLDDLKARIEKARHGLEPETQRPEEGKQRISAMAFALRVGVELAVALAMGGGIGWLLDRWLGTMPGFLLLFFFLGAAAGIKNVYRTAREIGAGGDEGEDGDDHESPPN